MSFPPFIHCELTTAVQSVVEPCNMAVYLHSQKLYSLDILHVAYVSPSSFLRHKTLEHKSVNTEVLNAMLNLVWCSPSSFCCSHLNQIYH